MGIRFRCHQCGHELHVKDFQGGKRSRCPECETKFRIPNESAELSIPLESADDNLSSSVANDSKVQAASVGRAGQNAGQQVSQQVAPRISEALSSKSVGNKVSSKSPQAVGTGAASIVDNASTNPLTDDHQQELTDEHASADGHAAVQPAEPTSPPLVPPTISAQPQAILEAPGATWYVRPPAGGQYGPAPANVFCGWLTENRVTRDSLVWRDGWPQWLVAGDVFQDYFGPAVPQGSVLPATTPQVNAAPETEQPAAPEFVAPLSLSDRALAARKRQRKKNYMIMIGVLATISIGLVVALVLVLMQNS